jgi:hypothetical protein
MTRLDFQGDVGHRTFHKIAKLYNLPEFVLNTPQDELIVLSKKANVHADVRYPYQFPCHNKAATVLSAAYFYENQYELPPKVRPAILDNLNKFAGYFGVADSLNALMVKHAEINRDSEDPDSDFAIVKVSSAGTKQRLYPMRNWNETKMAAAWYLEWMPELRNEFGFLDRQKIAEKIIDKTEEYRMFLPGDMHHKLEQHAGIGTGSPAKVAEQLRRRKPFAKEAAARDWIEKTAQAVERTPQAFLTAEPLADMADTMDKVDRHLHLINKYSEYLLSPEDVVFEATHTKIAELQDTVFQTTTGNIYTRDQLTKLSANKIRSLLGDDVADAITTGMRLDPIKLAEVASTLPRGDAELFDEMMRAVGEEPLHKSSAHLGLSPEVLGQIASI